MMIRIDEGILKCVEYSQQFAHDTKNCCMLQLPLVAFDDHH